MNITRRDLLKLVGGSAAGLMFTPVPWKALEDSSKWSQNWPWIQTPTRGEITTKCTTCTLCPLGCGVQARCVNGRPVSLSGIREHPVSMGGICAVGLAGHHLAYHPLRAMYPLRRTGGNAIPMSLDEAVGAIVEELKLATSSGAVAVLDLQPGRTVSGVYRAFLASLSNGVYIVPSSTLQGSFSVLADMMSVPGGAIGFDIEHASSVLSFGAPVLDGWGAPGKLHRRKRDGSFRLIQVETRQSETALRADKWVPVNPGTEAVLALGIARKLIACKTFDARIVARCTDWEAYKAAVNGFTPADVQEITGVNDAVVDELVKELTERTPAIVLAGVDPGAGPMSKEDQRAIWGLNLLLGAVGKPGGIVVRHEPEGVASPVDISSLPDHSIRLLFLDGAESGNVLPWHVIERKLVPGKSTVVSFSPFLSGVVKHANFVIPSPAYLESLQDVPTVPGSAIMSLSLSVPLLTAPKGTIDPGEFIAKLARAQGLKMPPSLTGSAADRIKARLEVLYASGRGKVFQSGGSTNVSIKSLSGADDVLRLLSEGGCWIDDEPKTDQIVRFSLTGSGGGAFGALVRPKTVVDPAYPLALMPFGVSCLSGSSGISPIMTKLYRESGLKPSGGVASIHPTTARSHGLVDGEDALIETHVGTGRFRVRFELSVMPGVIHVAAGPDAGSYDVQSKGDHADVLAICDGGDGMTWRKTLATIQRI